MAIRNKKALYVEPREQGGYKATWGNSNEPVQITATQQEAIEAAHKRAPNAAVHVARVRDTKYGHCDQFLKVH